jgi:long-chain acyl-CoA synthetase
LRSHLASLVDDFRRNGAQVAVVEHRGVRRYRTTYTELAELAGRFATEFAYRGIKSGDRVILWGENSAEWIAAFFGCVMSGIIAVPLDAAGSTDFAERVVAEVSPRLIVGDSKRLQSIGSSLARVSLDDARRTLPERPTFFVNTAVTLESPFQIVFTSGTTSEPKGIVHTHRNVLASLEPIEREIKKYLRYERLVHPLRFLHTLPLSHVFGQFMGLWIPTILAAELHFDMQLEPARTVLHLRRDRISALIAVPRTLELLRAHLLGRYPALAADLEAAQGISPWQKWWRFRRVHRLLGFRFWALICGGSSLPAELEEFWGRLGLVLIQGYGMTETAALVTLNHPFHVARGTLGKPLPGREVRLSPDGEILVRGPMVSGAVWREGHLQPNDSEWLATGDLAVEEPGGELRFTGRKGDAIVTAAGLNIHPADLEAALLVQPGVRGAVVVGCAGANGCEAVAVLLADGDDAVLRAAIEGANQRLAEFQAIRRVLRWPKAVFPFTSTGKLMRRRVAEWACAQLATGAKGNPAGSRDSLLALIAGVTGENATNAEDGARLSEDLRLDSLGRVQVQSAVEQQLGVEIPDAEMAALRTLGELRTAVTAAAFRFGAETPRAAVGVDAAVESTGDVSHQTLVGKPVNVVVGPAAMLDHRYPVWPWWTPARWLRVAFLELVMRPLVWVLAAPRVRRSAEVARGPLLIVANHVTAVDGTLVLYALPRSLRGRVAAAMAGEMLLDYRRGKGADSPWLDWLMPVAYWLLTGLLNVFPLPRFSGFRMAFEHAGEALDAGYSVLVFPEGTRSAEGQLATFRGGIGLLVQQARADVLPVALVGLGELKVARKGWFRSGMLEVRVGAPMRFLPADEPAAITARLETALRELMG